MLYVITIGDLMTDEDDPNIAGKGDPSRNTSVDDIWGDNSFGYPPYDDEEEQNPTWFSWINRRIHPFREAYRWLNRRFDPVRDVYHLSSQSLEQWYSRRHLFWRFIISISVAETVFLSVSIATSLIGEDGLPTFPSVPPFVPFVIAALTLFAFVQWLQIKQRIEVWSEPDSPIGQIRWGGVLSGAIIGGSLGSVLGMQGLVLGTAIGAVLADEAERRIDVRISRAAENRERVEQTRIEEIGEKIDTLLEERDGRELVESRR